MSSREAENPGLFYSEMTNRTCIVYFSHKTTQIYFNVYSWVTVCCVTHSVTRQNTCLPFSLHSDVSEPDSPTLVLFSRGPGVKLDHIWTHITANFRGSEMWPFNIPTKYSLWFLTPENCVGHQETSGNEFELREQISEWLLSFKLISTLKLRTHTSAWKCLRRSSDMKNYWKTKISLNNGIQ